MPSRVLAGLFAAAVLVTASCSRDPQRAKLEYLQKADGYAAQKKYAEAIIEYRNAIAQDAQFGEARLKLGIAYEAANDYRNALAEYVRAADLMPDSVDAQLRAGRLLLVAQQYADAKAKAMAALAKDPQNVTGLILLGNSLAGLKDLDSAITVVEAAINQDPHRTLSYDNLGVLQLLKRNQSAAEAALKRAVDLQPNAAAPHLSLANYYWAGKRMTDAEQQFKVALELEPSSPDANRGFATFLISQGLMANAEQYLKRYAEGSGDAGAKIILADYYLANQRTKDAVSVLEPLRGEPATFAAASLRFAAIDYTEGRHDQAYHTLDEIVKREPTNEQARLAKGRFLLNDKKAAEALALATAIVEAEPQSAAGHYLRGLALEATGARDAAIDEFQEVLKVLPTSTEAQTRLADLYLAKGDFGAAAEFAGQALQATPQSVVARFVLAKASIRRGDLARAQGDVAALERANPSSADVQALVGDLNWAKRDLPQARKAYERALTLEPNSLDALVGVVRVDLAEKRGDAARQRIDTRLATNQNNNATLSMLAGMVYRTVGDTRKAELAFKRALELEPANFEAYTGLARLYVSENRLDEAKRSYEDIAKAQTKPVVATTMIGIILELQNKQNEARQYYERALAIDPRNAVASNNLAWAYAVAGQNLDQALQLAQSAKSQLPDRHEVDDTLGWVYYKKSLSGLAISSFKRSVEAEPKNPIYLYHLGLAYAQNGDKSLARRTLNEALTLKATFDGADEARKVLSSIQG